ncbi:MAG: hypothetical protein K2Y27_10845 [Xanthobacteraceae bacterium]|nr:hypothetical protein [Xanthobacteraceae bacterium]
MDLAGRKLRGKRALIEFIFGVALVVAAPTLVVTQASQTQEPWGDMWLGDWVSPFDYDPALDPPSAALHERAAAQVRRMTKASGDVRLAGGL